MPLHVAPALRALEEALEADGLVQPLDSAAVAQRKLAEAQGQVVKVVPVGHVRPLRFGVYTAK